MQEHIPNQLKTATVDIPTGARAVAKAENRQALLSVAKSLFSDFGYHGTNLRDIARAANLSTGAFFANWKGKDDIYVEIYGHAPYTPEDARVFKAELDALKAGASC